MCDPQPMTARNDRITLSDPTSLAEAVNEAERLRRLPNGHPATPPGSPGW